jgi:hypothetical protein
MLDMRVITPLDINNPNHIILLKQGPQIKVRSRSKHLLHSLKQDTQLL